MPKVKKLRVVSAKYRKQFRDRYYSVDNLARRKRVEEGTHKKSLEVAIKNADVTYKSRGKVECAMEVVRSVPKRKNSTNEEGTRFYSDFSMTRITLPLSNSADLVNDDNGPSLDEVTPIISSSGSCERSEEEPPQIQLDIASTKETETVMEMNEDESEMRNVTPTPTTNRIKSPKRLQEFSNLDTFPDKDSDANLVDDELMTEDDNNQENDFHSDVQDFPLIEEPNDQVLDNSDDYLTTEDEDDKADAENVRKIVESRERRNMRWLNGDEDDDSEKIPNDKYAKYSAKNQPKRFQDYVKWKGLYPHFMQTGCKIMQDEIFEFQKILREDPFPPCQALQEGCIPWNLITTVKEVRPTLRTMREIPFNVFVQYLQWKGWHYSGLTKVIPPAGFMIDRAEGFDQLYGNPDFHFKSYSQSAAPRSSADIVQLLFENSKRIYDVQGWYKRCKELGREMFYLNPEEREQHILDTITTSSEYAKDIDEKTTLFLRNQPNPIWNPTNLDTIYKTKGNWDHNNIYDGYGLTKPYVYYGMYRSAFSWHTEDFNAFSLNYLHYGDPKIWYAVSPLYHLKWLHVQKHLYTTQLKINTRAKYYCSYLGTHKQFFIPTLTLNQHGIPTARVTQDPGTFIITHDASPHSGISTGFSAAEAVNFAVHTKNWPKTALHKHVCLKRNCGYAINTIKTPRSWAEMDLKEDFSQYDAKKGGLSSKDPYDFHFENEKIVRHKKPNPIGSYLFKDHAHETYEIGRRLRRIFANQEELHSLRTYKPEVELALLKSRNLIVKTY